jgi:hypothetical protein
MSAQAKPNVPNKNTKKAAFLLTIIKPIKKAQKTIQTSPFRDDTGYVQQVFYLLIFIES